MKVLAVTDREFSAIIAGLRLLQNRVAVGLTGPVMDLATNGSAHKALTVEEIERLIEKETAPVPAPPAK